MLCNKKVLSVVFLTMHAGLTVGSTYVNSVCGLTKVTSVHSKLPTVPVANSVMAGGYAPKSVPFTVTKPPAVGIPVVMDPS